MLKIAADNVKTPKEAAPKIKSPNIILLNWIMQATENPKNEIPDKSIKANDLAGKVRFILSACILVSVDFIRKRSIIEPVKKNSGIEHDANGTTT